jgi:hypothetical protein
VLRDGAVEKLDATLLISIENSPFEAGLEVPGRPAELAQHRRVLLRADAVLLPEVRQRGNAGL